MRPRQTFTLQSMTVCFIVNALLVGVLFVLGRQFLGELGRLLDPALAGADAWPEQGRQSLEQMRGLLGRVNELLAPVLAGLGLLACLVEGAALYLAARSAVARAEEAAASGSGARGAAGREEAGPAEGPGKRYVQSQPHAAVQILSILQRKGRFIDFLQEDLGPYDDSQIGAAVRSIHQGCKEALTEHLTLRPVVEGEEGAEVNVPPGFNPEAIQLIGDVRGSPPFKGVLRHRGWRVERLELPRRTSGDREENILAPAEVEIEVSG
ncbi:MAG: DUF2760 domain-containing protein [bacterium]